MTKRKWLNSLFRVICILAAIACVVVAVILFKKHKAVDEGYERQAIEESLASGYVDFLRAYAQELDTEQKSRDETGEEMSYGETEEKAHDETTSLFPRLIRQKVGPPLGGTLQ